jgi:hypothetical protein
VGLAVLVGLVGTLLVVRAQAGPEPEDAVSWVRQVVLEPIRPGEQSSKVISETLVARPSDVEQVVLEPMHPEDLERPAYKPTETSPIVRGPSDSPEYRCVVVLKPLEEGGKASEPVCGRGLIESVNGVSLESSYLIAKFYDNTNYGDLLIEYYGAEPCSPTVSYGRPDLREDGVDNRFASGEGFSSCDLITVYDGYNYTGPEYSCGPRCWTFYALNDHVSSWEATD